MQVDGSADENVIANNFADYFAKKFSWNNAIQADHNFYPNLFS
jgi:hypothetical protein